MLAGGAEELCPRRPRPSTPCTPPARRNERTDHHAASLRHASATAWWSAKAPACWCWKSMKHARARGATIHAEITRLRHQQRRRARHAPGRTHHARRHGTRAGECAASRADAVGYVNGHGTATMHGDIAESRATSAVFGAHMPISSQKSYLGHTLGACGALEAWFSIEMMKSRWFAPTLNLDHVDSVCGAARLYPRGRRAKSRPISSCPTISPLAGSTPRWS